MNTWEYYGYMTLITGFSLLLSVRGGGESEGPFWLFIEILEWMTDRVSTMLMFVLIA